jgi:superfamily II DNA or RNA helicase
MNQIVYVYTTNTFRTKNWYKIGETHENEADVRVKQQDNESNPEKLDIIYKLDISGLTDMKSSQFEKKIHNYYDRLGKRVRNRREWFEIDGGLDEIKKVIEQILDNTDIHKRDIILKPHQVDADIKMDECLNSGENRCLLAHKPRSGKTFITLNNIRKNNYKKVVILTSYPILNYQWSDLIYNYRGFSNTNVIIGSDCDDIILDDTKNTILLLSLQDVKGGDEVFTKDKFKNIKDTVFDLLVIDEVHRGVETEKTDEFLSKIKYSRLLGLSATPTKNLLSGRFSKDQIHSYTLPDEMRLKKLYPDKYHYPDINFLIWNPTEEEKKDIRYFSSEEQFNFNKFFRIDNTTNISKNDKDVIDYNSGSFYYHSDIVYLFKKFIGDKSICKKDKLGTWYPFKAQGKFSSVRTIILYVPNIHVQYRLKQLLKEIDSYDEFNIHITNSKEHSSRELINKIRRDFKSGDKRSIIIAVNQLTTGITLEDCDMVVLMNNWESPDIYIQTSFRPQSESKGKINCWVLDPNPTRSFKLMWEYQNIISANNGTSLTQNISEWLECVNVFNRVDGDFKRLDFDGFNNEYTKAVLQKPRFDYQSTIFVNRLKDATMIEALKYFKLGSYNYTTDVKSHDEALDSGKTKTIESTIDKKEEADKKEDISLIQLIEISKAVLDKTMLLSIFTNFEYDDLDDCLFHLESDEVLINGINKTRKQMYLETLLIGTDLADKISFDVIKFIYNNLYNKYIINKKIYIFNQNVKLIYNNMRENSNDIGIMLTDLMELIDNYLKPSTTEKRMLGEVFTPIYGKPGCVEDQLNLIEPSFWKRKDVKVLDPCAGIGNYSVVLIDKFMKGLSEEIVDPEQRLKWILEEIIYINEYQSKNLFIYLQLFDPENKYKMNFFRGDYLKLDIKDTFGVDKFDLICMNPPYQENNSENNRSKPLYNLFIEKALNESDKVISINPSRWMTGGFGLEDFRNKLFKLNNIRYINHIDDATIVFGNRVEIKGGVSYYLFDKYYNGYPILNGVYTKLDEFDIFVEIKYRDLLKKSLLSNNFLSEICRTKSYWMNFNDKELDDKKSDENLLCYVSQNKGLKKFIKSIFISKDHSGFKVFTPSASGSSGNLGKFGNKILGLPNEVASNTYMTLLVNSEDEAKSLISYMNTKFCNFFLSLRKKTQNMKPDTLKWIPLVPFDREWSDDLLFDYFNLTEEERNIVLNYDKK